MDTALNIGSTSRVYWLEFKYELLRLVRSPLAVFSIIGMPVAFFVVFGLANRTELLGNFPVPRYLIASYSCFGAMGSSLFAIGVGLAIERGRGWLELKRASPMPAGAYVLAKLLSGVIFGWVITFFLLGLSIEFADQRFSVTQVLGLFAVISCGVLCFAAIGVFAGLLLPSESAPGLMNLIYLPLSLCGGLWVPIEQLPGWMQSFAQLLPSYHFNSLALATLGYANDAGVVALLVLVGYAAVFTAGSMILFRRQESSR